MTLDLLTPVPWIPLIGAILCVVCCAKRQWAKAAGPICVISIAISLLLVLLSYAAVPPGGATVTAFNWIHVGKLTVDFSYYIDGLTMLMLLVVTGVATLIALYATGYMKGDPGYARFFAGVSLFVFAMTTLVMADNLVLLYLGWEGVSLCSYLLIGHYYDRPDSVFAAKEAFIVNRVGDLGFVLGIFMTWYAFGTLNIPDIINAAREMLTAGQVVGGAFIAIPFLLMVGAIAKSAQLPLYVWLPDAMAAPTPVSALVHAATMVTAGVYMIARLLPVFMLSPAALPVVAAIGAVTAIFAATIALCQYDLKKIWAYSTVSQLGYMFLGVGALSGFGGVFHLFTHAFFKALLFLTAGSVMHATAGQLDMRKLSGLRKRMPVTCWLTFAGCLALAGFPLTAGFWSKDTILADAMIRGLSGQPLYILWSSVGLLTAFLTAFYTFRVWFRVFMGPEHYEMGDEHHAAPTPVLSGSEGPGSSSEEPDDHAAPHEVSWWPMNAPLVVLAIGAILAGYLGWGWGVGGHGWIGEMIRNSTAQTIDLHPAVPGTEPTILGFSVHGAMAVLSTLLVLLGVGLAAYYHWLERAAADRDAARLSGLIRIFRNKYYIPELYDRVIVSPLRLAGFIGSVIDEGVIKVAAYAVAFCPRLIGYGLRPSQSGRLQGYGLGMVTGLGVIIALVIFATW